MLGGSGRLAVKTLSYLSMPNELTPDQLAERICRRLNLTPVDNAEAISSTVREALTNRFESAVAATKTACLTIAE